MEVYRKLENLEEWESTHIPKIYRLIERGDALLVVEEYIDGQTLDELLTYRPNDFTEDFVLEIILQLSDCLQNLYFSHIVHRDIKPSNIMLTKDNVVKLIDFGIARTIKFAQHADTEVLGTRGYAPPEQYGLFEVAQTDSRSDIYSLGVTMKILLGKDYDGYLLKYLDRCTALDPANRYGDGGELRAALNNRFISSRPTNSEYKRLFVSMEIFLFVLLYCAPLSDEPPPAEIPAPAYVEFVQKNFRQTLQNNLAELIGQLTKAATNLQNPP